MRWPSGVQSGLRVAQGRSSAGSASRGRNRRSTHPSWVARASRAPSGDTRTSRYESSGRPGSGEARPWRSTDTTVCSATATGPARDVDERAVGGHRDVSGARCGRHHALEHRRRRPCHLQPSEVECHGAQRPGDAVDQMARRHVMRVAAATDEHLRRAGLQIQHRNLRVRRCRRSAGVIVKRTASPPGRNSGHR